MRKTDGLHGMTTQVEMAEEVAAPVEGREQDMLVLRAANKMRAARQAFLKVEPDMDCRIRQLTQNESPTNTHPPTSPNHQLGGGGGGGGWWRWVVKGWRFRSFRTFFRTFITFFRTFQNVLN